MEFRNLLGFRKIVLSLFIACHLIALPLYLLPASGWRDLLLTPFLPYIEFCGLKQDWTVFAPAPPQCNRFMTARIGFDDGTSEIWEFPRMEKMGFIDKMIYERFRKWANDNVNDSQQAFIWPDTVKYIAELHTSKKKRPISISIIRNQIPIPLPGGSEPAITEVIYTEESDSGEFGK